ncbi:hypothetical protein ABIA65_001061 [Mycolicibacterium sp. 624]
MPPTTSYRDGMLAGICRRTGTRQVRRGCVAGQAYRAPRRAAPCRRGRPRRARRQTGARAGQRDRLGPPRLPQSRWPPPRIRPCADARDAAHPGRTGSRRALGVARHTDRAEIGVPRRRGPSRQGPTGLANANGATTTRRRPAGESMPGATKMAATQRNSPRRPVTAIAPRRHHYRASRGPSTANWSTGSPWRSSVSTPPDLSQVLEQTRYLVLPVPSRHRGISGALQRRQRRRVHARLPRCGDEMAQRGGD